jgi:hypothetical protein
MACQRKEQHLSLQEKPQIISLVATPGRIQDLGKEGALGASHQKFTLNLIFSNFKNFTVNFKDFLHMGGGMLGSAYFI